MTTPADRDPTLVSVTRRAFVKAVGAATVLPAIAATGPRSTAESPIGRFARSLTLAQRSSLAFPFDHPLRTRLQQNWKVVEPSIADLADDQQALCREILRGLCTDDGHERLLRLMADDGGGLDRYHVAVFGDSDAGGPCEWLLTGRHVTLRAADAADGGLATAGPLLYGHSATRRSANVWRSAGEQAERLFLALDPSDRSKALLVPGTTDTLRPGQLPCRPGLETASLDDARKRQVRDLLAALAGPFRMLDVEPIRAALCEPDGLESLRLTYYSAIPPANCHPADIWKLEGPGFAWFYHGTPHVHVWLTVAEVA